MSRITHVAWALGVAIALLPGCVGKRSFVDPGTPLHRSGDEIVVCGQFFHTGAPVVLWMDPGGYDAYRVECKFDPTHSLPTKAGDNPRPNRYSTFRRHLTDDVSEQIRAHGWDLPLLQESVDLFVIHYDVCGTSRRCFKVLHDIRGLSVQFMLDVDGTIYQTLDLKERAWHAGQANDRSIGIEIANMGAYPDVQQLDAWYKRDADGLPYYFLPESRGDGGVRTPDFVPRPSRDDPVTGVIQGKTLWQYDLTDPQYDSLIKLTATLCRVLPRIEPDYPRGPDGELYRGALTSEQLDQFSGILGHYHVTQRKIDPGPAFHWDRLLDGVRLVLDQ